MTQAAEFLPIHSPVEGAANISTVQPEFDIILVIGHHVLATCRSGTTIEEGKETHATTVPKTAVAGVMLEAFARFKPPVATFNSERVPSRPFDRWDSSATVERWVVEAARRPD